MSGVFGGIKSTFVTKKDSKKSLPPLSERLKELREQHKRYLEENEIGEDDADLYVSLTDIDTLQQQLQHHALHLQETESFKSSRGEGMKSPRAVEKKEEKEEEEKEKEKEEKEVIQSPREGARSPRKNHNKLKRSNNNNNNSSSSSKKGKNKLQDLIEQHEVKHKTRDTPKKQYRRRERSAEDGLRVKKIRQRHEDLVKRANSTGNISNTSSTTNGDGKQKTRLRKLIEQHEGRDRSGDVVLSKSEKGSSRERSSSSNIKRER